MFSLEVIAVKIWGKKKKYLTKSKIIWLIHPFLRTILYVLMYIFRSLKLLKLLKSLQPLKPLKLLKPLKPSPSLLRNVTSNKPVH